VHGNVPAKMRTAIIVLLCLVGLLADLHCGGLELLSLKVILQRNIIKMSFVEAFCPLRSFSLNSMIQTSHFNKLQYVPYESYWAISEFIMFGRLSL